MTDDLGARLLDAGLVTRALLAEVATLRGGARVEALVATGVSESSLAGFFLTNGYGPLQRREDLMEVHAHILGRVPARDAHALRVLPMGESPAGLVVAMADPSDAEAVTRLRHLTGSGVLPTVARVSDLRAALDRHYPEAADAGPLDPARPPAGGPAAPPEEEAVVELVRRRRAAPPAPPAEADEPVPLTRPKRSGRSSPAPGSPARPDSVPPTPEEQRWSDPAGSSSGAPTGATERRDRGTHPGSLSSAPPPRPAPARLESTLGAIRGARDRDEIVHLACEAGLAVARRVVFLALRKGVLKGWHGAGGPISAAALGNLWIPGTSASMFRPVLDEGQAYDGPYGEAAADHLFRSAIDGRGRRVVLQPVHVHERLVGVLCADGVAHGDAGCDYLAEIAAAVGQAFRSLLTASKR